MTTRGAFAIRRHVTQHVVELFSDLSHRTEYPTMTPDELKLRFDRAARRIRLLRRELRELGARVHDPVDSQAIQALASDLRLAARDCNAIGLHQLGQGHDIVMSYGHRAAQCQELLDDMEAFGRGLKAAQVIESPKSEAMLRVEAARAAVKLRKDQQALARQSGES